MDKELENLLEDLDSGEEDKTKYGVCYAYSPDVVEKLKQAITELKAIKEAKPSEALKSLRICWAGNQSMGEYISSVEYEEIEQALLKAQALEAELEEFLGFKDGRTISSVTYEGKQIVAMPLEKYNDLMEQNKVLEIIKELIGKHCKIELIDGKTYYQIKIKVMGSDYAFGMSTNKEEFNLLKRWKEK